MSEIKNKLTDTELLSNEEESILRKMVLEEIKSQVSSKMDSLDSNAFKSLKKLLTKDSIKEK